MKWQICRNTANGLRLGLVWLCFFIPAKSQSESPSPSHFLSTLLFIENFSHNFRETPKYLAPLSCFSVASRPYEP